MTRATDRSLKRNLREQVVDEIGGDIVSGRLKPGDFLPSEEVLLGRYNVSRTVLREALNVLAGKGILDARPKRGTIVRPRNEWSQLDPVVLGWQRAQRGTPASDDGRDALMEVRRIVEPGAAALAARRGTEEDFAAIEEAYAAMEKAGDSPEDFMAADLAFHTACLYASKNDFLAPIAHAIRSEMMASLRITNRDPETNRTISLPLHKAILDAIVARDPEAAATAMRRHLDDTERRRSQSRAAG
ncbi:FadR family transcriptional regulator [Ancylobacter sp. MQZ15Z-1]|uniref:FadR family transcriptional regulator n=1 Tax=Ancylobacter mangrovi TaxID=2972472 RepID=A0A9X2PH68_9HYPH|nr:FadR/GntR family transcriptional regulator [Ancylobacter mangrovi]MCS0494443.1 FadR family transcriptional regulator [Ancylobacter mangrovi]